MSSSISDIWRFNLTVGNSEHPSEGACAMDAVSCLMYGHLGDHPKCVCSVISDYVINLNDTFDDVERQGLRNYLLRLINTVDDENEAARLRYVMHHAMTVMIPLMLEHLHPLYWDAKQHALAEVCRGWRLPNNNLNVLRYSMPFPEVTGMSDEVAEQLQEMLPMMDSVFNGPSSMTLLSYYVARELQNAPASSLHPAIVQGLWDGLDGLLAIGKQGDEMYLTYTQIVEANERFVEASLN